MIDFFIEMCRNEKLPYSTSSEAGVNKVSQTPHVAGVNKVSQTPHVAGVNKVS